MKTLVILACIGVSGMFVALAPRVWGQAAGDVGSVECRVVQLDVQGAITSGGPYKNLGQLVSAAANVVSAAEEAGEITEECSSCIMNQFARRVPIGDQIACGPNPSVCGNGICEPGEDKCNCSMDCGPSPSAC